MGGLGGGPGGGRRGGVPPPEGGSQGGSGGSKMALPRGGPWLSTFWPLFIGDFSGAFGLADGWQGGGTPQKGQKRAKKGVQGGAPPRQGGDLDASKKGPKGGIFGVLGAVEALFRGYPPPVRLWQEKSKKTAFYQGFKDISTQKLIHL